tara:strand:- start:39 stop:506 length:468 start_codon:yes stop_codon:yes gene_type:complete
MFSKDTRIKSVDHPVLGKTCIAIKDIKKNDLFYFWGLNVGFKYDVPSGGRNDYLLSVSDNSTTIDPFDYPDSLLQFCNHPGPNECVILKPTKHHYVNGDFISQEFYSKYNIKKGTQITISYGDDAWFLERNIEIKNIACSEYLTKVKKNKRTQEF